MGQTKISKQDTKIIKHKRKKMDKLDFIKMRMSALQNEPQKIQMKT